jgi:ABC-2 type transport system ATP-binding protein
MVEAEYCNRLALMNRGKLIALDSPAAVRAMLHEPLLEIRCADVVRALRILQEAHAVSEAGLFSRTIHATVDDAAAGTARCRELLAKNGIAVEAIEQIEPSLEDVFVALVEASGGVLDA